jgi:sulfur carrier protein ThiS
MKVYIEKENKCLNMVADTVEELLNRLKINPTTVIVSKNGSLVIGSEKLSPDDEVKIFSVVSGG